MVKTLQQNSLLEILKTCIHYTGFNPNNGNFGIKVSLYITLYIIMTMNLVLYISYKCKSVYEKIVAFKCIIFLTVFLAFCGIIILFWNDLQSILSTFEEGHFKTAFKISIERRNLHELCNKALINHSEFWVIVIATYLILNTLVPIIKVGLIFRFAYDYKSIKMETLPLPYPFYYPEYFNNSIFYYIIVFSLQSLFNVLACGHAYIATVATTGAMKFLEFEIKLLSLSITEMESTMYSLQNNDLETPIFSRDHLKNKTQISHGGMRRFIAYFVNHHHNIYKKFKSINYGIKWFSSILKALASIYLCMTIYIIVQENDIIIQLKEFVFCIIWIYDIFIFDICGEQLTAQDEELRKTLFECPWINTPIWFKKSLLIIMIRSYQPLQIKPFGLYTLNFKNFTLTMNAVYSYYNLLRRMNSS